MCKCKTCDLNVVLSTIHKDDNNKIVPKFLCSNKYPDYYSAFTYECAKYICVNYSISCIAFHLYSLQRFSEEYYKEIELLINLSGDTNFSEIYYDGRRNKIQCIDGADCKHEHYLRDKFYLPIVLQGSGFERTFNIREYGICCLENEEINDSLEDQVDTENIKDGAYDDYPHIKMDNAKRFMYMLEKDLSTSLYLQTVFSKISKREIDHLLLMMFGRDYKSRKRKREDWM